MFFLFCSSLHLPLLFTSPMDVAAWARQVCPRRHAWRPRMTLCSDMNQSSDSVQSRKRQKSSTLDWDFYISVSLRQVPDKPDAQSLRTGLRERNVSKAWSGCELRMGAGDGRTWICPPGAPCRCDGSLLQTKLDPEALSFSLVRQVTAHVSLKAPRTAGLSRGSW